MIFPPRRSSGGIVANPFRLFSALDDFPNDANERFKRLGIVEKVNVRGFLEKLETYTGDAACPWRHKSVIGACKNGEAFLECRRQKIVAYLPEHTRVFLKVNSEHVPHGELGDGVDILQTGWCSSQNGVDHRARVACCCDESRKTPHAVADKDGLGTQEERNLHEVIFDLGNMEEHSVG